ncbi:hypothetical protein [Burkholderia thailandensis]|uniref:hypothetical protein n=2 Tax=Burkholderia thailandensis TaxID=57975 RepID=UPI0012B5DD77|nr:hypothetical protein [Burkholderia thailandensis]MBS2130655.1 hypothetical protein [Burkholderia thailandensis]MCS3400789.1 hypothetical protein [Burkholderia thailandensis]MCS6473278.1 hypothetical protein [Burkholderia thailandensis]MCS6479913.1 hypothetical protein [Burkholderia thailandensis]MCS6509150.1 hypothetical protein [Burkholderia thailandensis]
MAAAARRHTGMEAPIGRLAHAGRSRNVSKARFRKHVECRLAKPISIFRRSAFDIDSPNQHGERSSIRFIHAIRPASTWRSRRFGIDGKRPFPSNRRRCAVAPQAQQRARRRPAARAGWTSRRPRGRKRTHAHAR